MRTAGKICFLLGSLIVILTLVLFLVSYLFDYFYHPHDMNLPGLLAVASLFYGAPVAVLLFLAGTVLYFLGE